MAYGLGHEVSMHTIKDGNDDAQLAYTLFIELLAYQLASPVRWIETQESLLSRNPRIGRFIEIGPRATLSTIAKRSAAKYHASDAPSQWSDLQFLSYPNDKDQIMYQSPSAEDAVKSSSKPKSHSSDVTKTPQTDSVEVANISHPTAYLVEPMEPIHRPLLARHVVLAMTAHKTGHPFDKVSMEKTIRTLAGGKSTLQNELTGDLVAEFGKLPDGVEDLSLAALSEALQPKFSGYPAACMNSLISKFISRKMPAGFNQSTIYEYLLRRWSITKSHAMIPMCLATTTEPPSRLANTDEAHAYFDDVAQRYAILEGLNLEPNIRNQQMGSLPSTPFVVDPSALEAVTKKQDHLHRKLHQLLSENLQTDKDISIEEDACGPAVQQSAEKLEQWNAEFGDEFLESVQSIFNEKHARCYDSWWNWVREDLLRWIQEISQATVIPPMELTPRLQQILNRWDSTCSSIMQAELTKLNRQQANPKFRPEIQRLCTVLMGFLNLGVQAQASEPAFVYSTPPVRPKTTITKCGQLEYTEVRRQMTAYGDVVQQQRRSPTRNEPVAPFVHLKTREDEGEWAYNPAATKLFHSMLELGSASGLSYSGKAVLLTGAGPDSIGAGIVQGLLSGGARVVVTTSRPMSESADFFQKMYRTHGARGASLTVYPMNQASRRDCEALIEHIYNNPSSTGGDLDYIIPFAAMAQTGEPESLNGRNEVALRAMLVNVLRLVGCVRREKQKRRIDTRPTMCILPMSCNEGTFGGDGLYAESKIGLKALFNRFYSESWSEHITVCGALIGWTRGTGLMRSSNIIAEEVERLGLLTFTQEEMAFNILGLMTPPITQLAEDTPVFADLTGGFGQVWKIKDEITAARQRIADRVELYKALAEEDARHDAVLFGQRPEEPETTVKKCRANLRLPLPSLPEHADLTSGLSDLQGMIDLSTTVVVVGYSELGPWGNSRTRWEMEHQGGFSLEGYVEMAWIMGLIKHIDGTLNGEPYIGWVDAASQAPVRDDKIPEQYHDHIMAGSGLRLIKPTERDKYDPAKKEFLHEVAIEEDLPPFESSRSSAEAFKRRHGDHVSMQAIPGSDDCRVFIKKGSVLMVPKSTPFHQVVAGRIPDGWDPARFGVPEDILWQVDATTLYALCCVSEAFLSAGIKDPYELYEHIHVSELANCLGTGGGPMKIIQNMYRDRYLDRPMRGDIILEHFFNSMGAWVNMLLLSATGPLKTPVGACATALESLDIGCEAIQAGKCKVALVGGCDDYREELAYEFANIKATANSAEELAQGRRANEISRPTATSRSGFAESAGCGVQLLMSAELALQMGVPIYGIVAHSQMASDQIGRSIPAPGKGILTAAREAEEAKDSPVLGLNFRRERLDREVSLIAKLSENEESAHIKTNPEAEVERVAQLRIRDAQQRWGNNLRLLDPGIAPIKAALATWGLTIDDIDVVSMHGTSTKANEVNESDVINTQMEHLGRLKGNPLICVCQKSLTGHPKAAAGAWQLNGCLQMMQDGVVPGNRNADNVDEQLRQFQHLVYPFESMRDLRVKATMLTSFGFGQKGAINIMVAPMYLFASVSSAMFCNYRSRAMDRGRKINPVFVTRVLKNTMVQVKSQPPWKDPESMRRVLLDPNSRLNPDHSDFISEPVSIPLSTAASEEHVPTNLDSRPALLNAVHAMLGEVTQHASQSSCTQVGIDIEELSSINMDNQVFLERNFTPLEREYCWSMANPRASFAGRWSAKEAVFKSLQTPSAGPGASMCDIEIMSVNGVPKVNLLGNAKLVATAKGLDHIEVTISHCAETAIAVALATGGSNNACPQGGTRGVSS
ncbi:hypothetical protein FE257_000086 [Aspergillus nanangensis]|uniref:Fatty acid synthase subunit alpha n=1 Tax=Aspergillus nanangensis TaxID=2582783 RepID=A0AAD4GYR9_ASPNN|nr:hypothetical protein FE257_000086 [Aspergillus nanangensis]